MYSLEYTKVSVMFLHHMNIKFDDVSGATREERNSTLASKATLIFEVTVATIYAIVIVVTKC